MFTTLLRTIRTLQRAPVFVAVATLSLAVGIGLSTATFAIVDASITPKIPLADVDRLFVEHLRLGDQRHPPPILEQVRALESLPGIERVTVEASNFDFHVLIDGNEYRAFVSRTTPDFFSTLGITPMLGRLPNEEEIRLQSTAVLTAFAWHRLFPKRDRVDGAIVTIGDRDYPVIGVLPIGIERLLSGDVWLPAASEVDLQSMRMPKIIAKLRPGTDSLAIRPQLAAVAANFTAAYSRAPAPPYELTLKNIRAKAWDVRDNELALLMIGIAIGVLAIACTNVSALALARGLTRRRDYALRVALGASRSAIAGEVLAEVVVLAAIGTIAGFLLAIAVVGMLTHIVPEDLRWTGYFIPELSARVFAVTTLTLVAGIAVAGGIPAWRASRVNPSDPLKEHAGTTTGRARSDFKILVIGELAIAMALLMLASLMTLSTRNLNSFDFGFDARQLISASISFQSRHDSLTAARKEEIVRATMQRVRDLRGIASVSYAGYGRLDDDHVTSDIAREAEPLRLTHGYMDTGPNFFATAAIPLVSGRDFTEGDHERGAVILSQRAATLLFPHGDALGRMVKLGGERSARGWLPVVGITRDVHIALDPNPAAGADTIVFATTPAREFDYTRLVIRPTRNTPALSVAIARLLHDGLPPSVHTLVAPFAGGYENVVRIQKFFDQLFSFLGIASLLLGAAGLFSVLSYTVSQRLREFAVRQALGASPRQVLRLVMRGAFELALGGTAFGALLSFWASAGVSGALFGVKNTDPVSLILAESTLLLVTMLASLVPAIRAMRADPVEVLRAA